MKMDEFDRLRELGSNQPGGSAEAQDTARAALLARISESEGTEAVSGRRPRRRLRGFLGISGAAAAAAIVLFAILSSGKAPTGAPELARAAEVELLARFTPNLLIHGPQWNVAGVEVESAAEGRTVFYSEFRPETPVRWDRSRFAELRWRVDSAADRISELKAGGWAHLETQRIQEIDLGELEETGESDPPQRVTQIFSPTEDSGGLQPRIALWEVDGRTFELEAFSTLELFEETSERVQKVDTGEYISRSRPGLTIKPMKQKGFIVSAPPRHAPDTPAQERALFRKVFLNHGRGERPIVRHADGRTWLVIRRYAGISAHWLPHEGPASIG